MLLDGLRGMAAIFVMLFHMELVAGTPSGPFSQSYLFVDFFFLLSGFVLTLSFEERLKAGLSTLSFMRIRAIRLWPVIAIGVAIGAIRYSGDYPVDMLAIATLLGLLMIPMMQNNGLLFPLNGPHWSLLHELIANVAHGLVLRRLGDRSLLAIAVAAGAVLAATVLHLGENSRGPFTVDWIWALPRIAFSYPLGVWMGRRWLAAGGRPLVSWRAAFILPPLLVMALPYLPLPMALRDGVTVILAFPLLLWLGATSEVPEHAREWLRRLGALSFPLYAIHLPMLEAGAALGTSWPVRFTVAGMTVLAALAIAQVTEGRTALLRRGWHIRRAARMASAVQRQEC